VLCLKSCPTNAIIGEAKKVHIIIQEKCTKCGACYDVCPTKFAAVIKNPVIFSAPVETDA